MMNTMGHSKPLAEWMVDKVNLPRKLFITVVVALLDCDIDGDESNVLSCKNWFI